MNILWIEDFGGGLDTGTSTLNLMFQDLISFDNWDEDEIRLLDRPADLENFFKDNSALYCVFLCRHYFDYEEFKSNYDILTKIDAVIIDIRLNNKIDLDLSIPNDSKEKLQFHENAGFYIYNDLVHLGVPSEKMCFMTGEKNSFTGFEKKCRDIYLPKVTGFEKNDAEYKKLRKWIKEQESNYTILRRGIIEGCHFLKSQIEKGDEDIQFRDFIKFDKEYKQPAIEVVTADIINYLDTLAQFLSLKQEQNINVKYRLFLRTLVHEWEENINPNEIRYKFSKKFEYPHLFKCSDQDIHIIHTFAWLSKMTRNWTSHANLLEPLNPQILAFLFLVNMRAMFKLPKEIQLYEQILFCCLPKVASFNVSPEDIKLLEKDINEIMVGLKIPEYKECQNFGVKINLIYRQNTGNPDAEPHDFKNFLLQYFWVNQREYLNALTSRSGDFLPVLARHIYKSSFPKA